MSNPISRPAAESFRRRAIEIASFPTTCAALESERRACVALWNEFCVQETARLNAKPIRIDPTVALFGG